MNNETIDEKLEYLVNEVMDFYEFFTIVGEQYTQESYEINKFEVSKLIGDFYEKNGHKYNNTQLVYQFLMTTFKRDKGVMKMYKAFKRLQTSQ